MSRLRDAGRQRVAAETRPAPSFADIQKRTTQLRRRRRAQQLAGGVVGALAVALVAVVLVPGRSSERVSTGSSTTISPTTGPKSSTTPSSAPPPPVTVSLFDVSFVDASDGFVLEHVCQRERVGPCTEQVAATHDGGQTFGPLGAAVPDRERLGDELTFATKVDGIVWNASGARAYVTHDGGRTWSTVPYSPVAVSAIGDDVWLLDADEAGTVLSSVDGFHTLRPVGHVPRATSLARANATVGYAAGPAALAATADGGRTWTSRPSPCRGAFGLASEVAVAPDGVVWLVCTGQGEAGHVGKALYRSGDSGRSWNLAFQCPMPPGPPRVHCTEDLSIGSPVSLAATDAGVFLGNEPWWLQASYDGGRSWSTAVDATSNGYPEMDFVTGTVGFATGDDGNPDTTGHAALFATTDGGRTWVRRYTSPYPTTP